MALGIPVPSTPSTVAAHPRPALERWALAGILFLAAALRFGALGQECLWADEFHNAALEPTWRAVLAAARDQGVQAPYFLLTHAWLSLAGRGDIALRLPSAIFGTLTVLLMYWAALGLFRRRGPALAAAALLAVSPMHVWYSQEARPYAMQVFFEVAALAALAWGMRNEERGEGRGARDEQDKIQNSALLIASAVLAIVAVETHYFAIFVWAAFAVVYLLAARPLRLIRKRAALGLLALLGLGAIHPLLGIAERLGPRRDLQSFLPASYGPSLIVDVLRAQLLGPHTSPLPFALQIAGIVLGSAVLLRGAWILLMRNAECGMRNEDIDAPNRATGMIVAVGWVLALVMPTAISFIRPIVYYGQRWLIIAVPFTVLLLAAGMGSGRGRPRSQGFVCALFMLLHLAYFPPYYLYRQKHLWDVAAAVVAREARPGESVFVIPGRDAGLLERYMKEKRKISGLEADPESTLHGLRSAPRGRIFLVCYRDLGPWLAAQGVGRVGHTWSLETHQPGQTLWVSEVIKN